MRLAVRDLLAALDPEIQHASAAHALQTAADDGGDGEHDVLCTRGGCGALLAAGGGGVWWKEEQGPTTAGEAPAQ